MRRMRVTLAATTRYHRECEGGAVPKARKSKADGEPDWWPASTLPKLKIALAQSIMDKHEKLCAADYDGVSGLTPEWVPQWHKNEFLDARTALVNRCGGDVALATQFFLLFVGLSRGAIVPGRRLEQNIPPKLIPYLVKLRDLRRAVQLGDSEGLATLAGESAAQGRKFQGRGLGSIGKRARLIEDLRRIQPNLTIKEAYRLLPESEQENMT